MLATTAASGQSRLSAVPSSMLPPAGLCRVWIEGVPASRQPAVTDCATARASLRTNSRVIYGGSSNGRLGLDPRDPRNDERLNPNSPRYDPVYAERVRGEYDRNTDRMTREERMRYEARQREERLREARNEARVREEMRLREEARLHNDSRYSNEREKRNRELQKDERKREKEIEKSERKRDKEWKKDKKHDGDRHDRDDH